MKKLFLFLTLLFVGIEANAQYTPSNNLNYVKLLKVPPAGSIEDSIMVYDGSDSFVKMRPASNLPISTATQTALNRKQNTLTNPVTGTGTDNFLTKWNGATTQSNSTITDNGTEIMTNSRFVIGLASGAGINLLINKNISGAVSANGLSVNGVVQSGVTNSAVYNRAVLSTVASTFTITDMVGYKVQQGTVGSGSVITNQYGYQADATLIGGVNNYGFYGSLPSGSTRWNLYMEGTAKNYLNGTTLIGNASDNLVDKLQITGSVSATVDATNSNQLVRKGQLDLKANISNPTFTTGITTPAINLSGQTASTVAIFDISKNIVSASTAVYPNLTELTYGKGVISPIQAQIDSKATNILTGYISGAGTVSSTDTVLAAIQKLNGNDGLKANLLSPIFTGMPEAPTPTTSTGIANKSYVDTAVSTGANWTKTVNNIRNNNTGEVEIKPLNKVSILNSSNIEVAKMNTGGAFTTTIHGPGSGFFTADGFSGMTQSGNQLTFRTSQDGFYFYKPTINHTANEINLIQFGSSETGSGFNINPTSGTGITNLIKLAGVVNQTGGANGITRAIYISPTLTSAADFRAIEVTAGKTILQETEAKKLNLKTTAGSQAVGNATMVGGTVTINTTAATTNSIVMLTRNSTGITGFLSYSTTNGTLTINSSIFGDAGIISYLIIN